MSDPRLKRGETSRERRIPEELLISKLIPDGPPRAMYDLGVGCFCEFRTLKIVYPDMELFGCEPCPAAYEELLPMFDGKLVPKAIGVWGRAELYLTHPDQGGSSLKPAPSELSRDKVTVDVWSLDQFDAWAGKPDRILLWMDIEGSEMDALRGGTELLRSGRVHWMNIETRDAPFCGHPTTAEVSALLKQFGYTPIHRYNVQGAYPEAPGDVVYFKEGVVPLRKIDCNWGVQPK